MSLPYEQRLDELMTQYHDHLRNMSETQRRTQEITATATAPKRAVSVTVDFRGELTDISFPTKAYRTMPPAEFAAVLMKVIAEARATALEEVGTVLAPMLPAGMSMAGVLDGSTDWGAVLAQDPPGPEAVTELVERRFDSTNRETRS